MRGMSEGELEMNVCDLANKLVKLQKRVEEVEYQVKKLKNETTDLQMRTMTVANKLYE